MATVAPVPMRAVHRPDPRDQYAIAIQDIAAKELKSLSTRKAFQGVTWASSLEAAPAAVGVMAIPLKAASKDAAAGLGVASRDIKGDKGVVVAMLPHKLLHSNLEYCSEQGRQAFVECQQTMDLIQRTSERMIQDDGSVAYIIELLEDLDEAKNNLLPEIKQVEESARLCLTNIKELYNKFEFWYWVIVCLRNNFIEGRGM
jgi:hypothetical protein